MKIEILFPEICCLYGDKANMAYLRKCLPDAEFMITHLTDTPHFTNEAVDMLYLCSMSEKSQEIVIKKLMPLKNIFRLLFDEETTLFLFTGNALEVFAKKIEREDGSVIEGLGLFDLKVKRQCPKRFNSLVLADFNGTPIVGYTSRFSHAYGNNEENYLFKVVKGSGINDGSAFEGLHFKKVYATYLLGPLLIANPDFTEYILSKLGAPKCVLPFEEDVRLAYEVKLKEYQNKNLSLY